MLRVAFDGGEKLDVHSLVPAHVFRGDGRFSVAFHCYAGTVDQQDSFYAAFPNKEIYFTGEDWYFGSFGQYN